MTHDDAPHPQVGARLAAAAAGSALATTALVAGPPLGTLGLVVTLALSALLTLVVGLLVGALGVPRAEVGAAAGYALGLVASYAATLGLGPLTGEGPSGVATLVLAPVAALAAPLALLLSGDGDATAPSLAGRTVRAGTTVLVVAAAASALAPVQTRAEQRADLRDEVAAAVAATGVPLLLPRIDGFEPRTVLVDQRDTERFVTVGYRSTGPAARSVFVRLHASESACSTLLPSAYPSESCSDGPGSGSAVVEGRPAVVAVEVDGGTVVVDGAGVAGEDAVEAVRSAEPVSPEDVADACRPAAGTASRPVCSSG